MVVKNAAAFNKTSLKGLKGRISIGGPGYKVPKGTTGGGAPPTGGYVPNPNTGTRPFMRDGVFDTEAFYQSLSPGERQRFDQRTSPEERAHQVSQEEAIRNAIRGGYN